MSHVTSGARCCGRVASSAARREPEGGDGVAEGVGHQTQNGTGWVNSFLADPQDLTLHQTQSDTKDTSITTVRVVEAREHRAGG